MMMNTSNKQQEVHMMKYKRVVISNRHLKELYNDPTTKMKMFTILFKLSREEIFSIATNINMNNARGDVEKDKGFKDSEKIYLNLSNESWKCMLYISWNDIQNLRSWIEGYDIRTGRVDWKKYETMMIRELEFRKKVEVGEDEGNEDVEKGNKRFNFKFKKTRISPFPINVHVFSKV